MKFNFIMKIKNELILCTQSHNDTIDFRTFGDTIINECQIDYQYFKSLNYSSIFSLYLNRLSCRGKDGFLLG